MAPALTVKIGDTYPVLSAQLTDVNGAINLSTAAQVRFVMKGTAHGAIVEGVCTIVNAAQGQVSYAWLNTDLQQADTYSAEFEILWGAGGVQKVPNALAANPQIEVDPAQDYPYA